MPENTKESPFTPGKPVPVEYFVARFDEIKRLERAIRQARSGRNENIFITGERGIGKSSLAGFIQHLAEKEYNFIGAHCFLGQNFKRKEILDKVSEKERKIIDNFLRRIKKLGIIGETETRGE